MSIMELSPYLKAIQEVVGSTPGEKYREISSIVCKLVSSRNIKRSLKNLDFPEVLKPLVEVEIARKLRQPDMILEALKSESWEVTMRAVKARWFFNGGNKMTSVGFYQTQIFPFVSVKTRRMIIKALADNLTEEPELADNFYELVTLMYGEKQAKPLLKVCSESFIWNRIKNFKFNYTVVHFLYYKYPEMVIKYLRLSKSDPENFNFTCFARFLPRLLLKHPEVFEELVEKSDDVPMLSARHTGLFLKHCFDAFLNNPHKFLQILAPRVLERVHTEEQRESVFKILVVQEVVKFENAFIGKFKFLGDGKKLSILMSAYKEKHNVDFLDCHEKITPKIMRILPKEDRIRIAKAKFEEKTSPASVRFEVIKRMIYSCVDNNDSDSLLDVLKYIQKKFDCEQHEFWANVLRFLWRYTCSMNLSQDHWAIISEFLMKIIEDEKKCDDLCIQELMAEKVRLDITNLDHEISPFLKYMFKHYRSNFLKLVPSLAKISLEKLINEIPSTYDDVNDISIEQVIDLVKMIGEFNAHNSGSCARVSVKNFPWLAACVKKFLIDRYGLWRNIKGLSLALRDTERRLYEAYVPERHWYIDIKSIDALRTLKKDPEVVKRNWKCYWNKCLGYVSKRVVKRFIRNLRWYQDLPIMFAEKSLHDMKNQVRKIVILGLLMEGPAFERLVGSEDGGKISKPYMPQAISCVRPPVSLEFALKY
ncbi:hypothetical protein KQX54_013939 [Cotesia glomerata]|uniref:Uncharacterized protein n=1 Tax=Cotesia glomerata TaxID=32391 RepID=A0AAV7IJR8_COTGL|nr:hypothetical protein KQX54_013939 [Cotesia glomerata]